MNKTIQKNLLFPEIIWERPVHYYKNKGGRIFILAGSRGNPSRASLICESVFRSGTGIITLGFPDILKNIFKDFLPEEMTMPLSSTPAGSISQNNLETILDQIKASDVLIMGPGLSINAETTHLIWEVIINSTKDTVICDDAVRAFIKGIEVIREKEDESFLEDYFKKIKQNILLVIGPDELLKIIKAAKLDKYKKPNIDFIKKHEQEVLIEISNRLNIGIILNNKEQSVVFEEELIITKLGDITHEISNDIIAGVVGSFIGQNPGKIAEASATGQYLIVRSYLMSKDKSPDKIIVASDVIRELPEAIKNAEKD